MVTTSEHMKEKFKTQSPKLMCGPMYNDSRPNKEIVQSRHMPQHTRTALGLNLDESLKIQAQKVGP